MQLVIQYRLHLWSKKYIFNHGSAKEQNVIFLSTCSALVQVITNVDVQSIEPVDQHMRDSLSKSVQMAIEISTKYVSWLQDPVVLVRVRYWLFILHVVCVCVCPYYNSAVCSMGTCVGVWNG